MAAALVLTVGWGTPEPDVMLRGRWLDRGRLDELLQGVKERAGNQERPPVRQPCGERLVLAL